MSEQENALLLWLTLKHGLVAHSDVNLAIAYYSSAIEQTNDPAVLANLYLARGCGYAEQGNDELAIANQSDAIRLDPTLAEAYEMRGRAYKRLKLYDQAISDYAQAIQIEPNRAEIYRNRGDALAAKSDFTAAIADYDEAIKRDPSNVVAYINRGEARRSKGLLRDALEDQTKAIELDPQSILGYFNRGATHNELKEYEKSITDFEKYLALGGGNINHNQQQVEEITKFLKGKVQYLKAQEQEKQKPNKPRWKFWT